MAYHLTTRKSINSIVPSHPMSKQASVKNIGRHRNACQTNLVDTDFCVVKILDTILQCQYLSCLSIKYFSSLLCNFGCNQFQDLMMQNYTNNRLKYYLEKVSAK